MKKLLFIFATVLFFAGTTVINAQDNNDTNEAGHQISININTHALVDVEAADGEATSINLTPTAPKEAGLGLDFDNATNNSLWLNYSSIITQGQERSISVSMNGELPTGMTIELKVGSDAGAGKGNLGNAVTVAKTLSSTGVPIVNNIKSCYTGSGANKGHNLTYSLKMDEAAEYGVLEVANHVVDITYTITGN